LPQVILDRISFALREKGVIPQRDYIAVHPFAHWNGRALPMNRLEEFLRQYLSHFCIPVVLLGTPEEFGRHSPLLHWDRENRMVQCFPSHTLSQTAVVISKAQLVIGTDSGLLHLAATLGKRVIGLFGPSPPFLTAPRFGKGVYLYEKLPCSPCRQRYCPRIHNSCMNQIQSGDLLDAIAQFINLEGSADAGAKPGVVPQWSLLSP
jgi:ADP-heptose:LPS heptosyltransferase